MSTKVIAKRKFDLRPQYLFTAQLIHLEGNERPYFSLTGEEFERGRIVAFGCLHEEFLQHFPAYRLLVDIHLSDDRGIPMHAVENGWYWYGGTKWVDYSPEQLSRHLRCEAPPAGMKRPAFVAFVERQFPRWQEEANRALEIIRDV